MTPSVGGVLFDLDDTLYPQQQYLAGAWRAVAEAGRAYGLDVAAFEAALLDVCAAGSDRGRIIDRAVARVGSDPFTVDIAALVQVFTQHRPRRLRPYPGTRDALARLRRRVPIGLVSDGNPAGQRAKLRALGLDDAFDVVVLSDEWGRDWRKPDPRPFAVALARLGVAAPAAVMIGDRPDKDVAGAARVRVRAVRVRTGEYRGVTDAVAPWRTVPTVVEAVALVEDELSGRQVARVG